jgi:hypothetical protein
MRIISGTIDKLSSELSNKMAEYRYQIFIKIYNVHCVPKRDENLINLTTSERSLFWGLAIIAER